MQPHLRDPAPTVASPPSTEPQGAYVPMAAQASPIRVPVPAQTHVPRQHDGGATPDADAVTVAAEYALFARLMQANAGASADANSRPVAPCRSRFSHAGRS